VSDLPERIPPLEVKDFTPEQAELVGDWTHLAFSRVIVRHPAAYRVFLPLIDKVIRGSNLPPRDREVIVLRLLGLCGEVYEQHHHEMIARNAGMSDAEIAAAQAGEGEGLSPFDLVLCRAAEELLRDTRIGDATWAALAQRYDEEQLMEVVFLGGCYTAMAMLTKSFGIGLEQQDNDYENITSLRQYT
jgi:alkylhydroperoxidase family enzyme